MPVQRLAYKIKRSNTIMFNFLLDSTIYATSKSTGKISSGTMQKFDFSHKLKYNILQQRKLEVR